MAGQGEPMIDSFFMFESTRTRLCQEAGSVGPYLPFLAASLCEQGYAKDSARRKLHGAAAFGGWLAEHAIALQDADKHLSSYFHHLDLQPYGRRPGAATCVKQLLQILDDQHLLRKSGVTSVEIGRVWIERFDEYLKRVTNVVPGTRSIYIRHAKRLIKARFGDKPPAWSVLTSGEITEFTVQEASRGGGTPRRGVVTATRAFLKFLHFSGNISAGLVGAVPSIREWKLSSLPRYLASEDVERVLSSGLLTCGRN